MGNAKYLCLNAVKLMGASELVARKCIRWEFLIVRDAENPSNPLFSEMANFPFSLQRCDVRVYRKSKPRGCLLR